MKYFAASNGFSKLTEDQVRNSVVVVIGCGPVGLCAVTVASAYEPRRLFAIDGVVSRLEKARSVGAEPLNYATDADNLRRKIHEATDGRGADIVLEVVGAKPAMQMAFDIVRNGGIISSVGVHSEDFPFTASQGE